MISSSRIGKPVLVMEVKVSKDKNSRWVDGEMKQNQKPRTKTKVINRGKRSKILSEVKPVENKSQNQQGFLEISPVQKGVLLSHKLRDYAYEY